MNTLKIIPSFDLDLDLPESARWNHIFLKYKDKFNIIKNNIDSILYSSNYIMLGFTTSMISVLDWFGKIKYSDELKSLSKISGIEFNKLVMLQLCYELSSACTTIVTKVDGKYTMFRTMDWPFDFLKDFTANINFIKNNKLIYTATTWIGYVGVMTATIPNKYSLAINYRRTQDMSTSSMLGNAFRAISMAWPVGHLIRNICDDNLSFDEAYNFLATTNLISPCYITLCRITDTPLTIIRDPSSSSTHHGNYIIQTNCDNDKNEPDILWSVKRRSYAKEIIKKYKSNFENVDQLVDNLLVNPILNDETIYLSVCCPVLGTHEAYST